MILVGNLKYLNFSHFRAVVFPIPIMKIDIPAIDKTLINVSKRLMKKKMLNYFSKK